MMVFDLAVRELGGRIRISGNGVIELNGRRVEHDFEDVNGAKVIVYSKAEKVVDAWQKLKKSSKLAHFPRKGTY